MSTVDTRLSLDEAKVRRNIFSFSALADQGAFEYLGRLFAKEATIDYTELFGGEPAVVSNITLMQQWAGLLPGFDATLHELSNLQVKVDGENALATADVTASHFIGSDGFWAITGHYEIKLQRSEDDWLIHSLKIYRKDEQGSRDVLAQATEHAEKNGTDRTARLVQYR